MTPPYDTPATLRLVEALRAKHGLDIAAARAALAANAHPDARLLDLTRPELEGFAFPALAYASTTALDPAFNSSNRLDLLRDLIDRKADHSQAAAFLLAVYSDLWESHPRTARRMAIGLRTLHTAVAPYLTGQRPLPQQTTAPTPVAPALDPNEPKVPF